MSTLQLRACLITLLCVFVNATAAAGVNYSWTEILISGKTVTSAFGPNNNRQIAVTNSDGTTGIYRKGVFTPLPTPPPGYQVSATGINDAGVIVGFAYTPPGTTVQGFILAKGQYSFFAWSGWDNTEPRAIGNSGLVTGVSFLSDLSQVAGFVYNPATGVFTNVFPSAFTIAQGINIFGRVSGSERTQFPGGQEFGFIQSTQEQVAFSDVVQILVLTRLRGINDWGTVVGFGFDSGGGHSVGFVGSASTGYQLLVPPGGDVNQTVCEGINNAAQVVCLVGDADGNTLGAFLGSPQIK
jgi:hypothetical protein